MNKLSKDSLLSKANSALRRGEYDFAIKKYKEALKFNPFISEIIKFNLEFAEEKKAKYNGEHEFRKKEDLVQKKHFASQLNNKSDLNPVYPKNHTDQKLKRFGAAFLGPILAKYFYKLRQEIKNNIHIKELFFLSREGYFLELAFKRILQNPEEQNIRTSYLVCSRTLLFKLSLLKPEDWEDSLKHHYLEKIKIPDFFRNRYAFTEAEINEIRLSSKTYREIENSQFEFETNKHLIILILQESCDVIQRIIKPKYDAYLNYLKEINFLNNNGLHIVDIGFSGTIQKLLHKISSQNITGHYFLTTKNAKNNNNLVFKGHILENILPGTEPLLDRSLYMEAILTAPYGQAIDVGEDDGKEFFRFGNKTSAQDRFEELRMIVEGAIEYASFAVDNRLIMTSAELSTYYNVFVNQKNNFPEIINDLFNIDDKISGLETINPINFFLKS